MFYGSPPAGKTAKARRQAPFLTSGFEKSAVWIMNMLVYYCWVKW